MLFFPTLSRSFDWTDLKLNFSLFLLLLLPNRTSPRSTSPSSRRCRPRSSPARPRSTSVRIIRSIEGKKRQGNQRRRCSRLSSLSLTFNLFNLFNLLLLQLGTIGHVAHGKSTVVKAISGVQTVRFKNELERNITIKLGYANAKIYKAADPNCPRPRCYRAYGSSKEDSPACDAPGFEGTRMELLRHVSFVDCPGELFGGESAFSFFWLAVVVLSSERARSARERGRMKERARCYLFVPLFFIFSFSSSLSSPNPSQFPQEPAACT